MKIYKVEAILNTSSLFCFQLSIYLKKGLAYYNILFDACFTQHSNFWGIRVVLRHPVLSKSRSGPVFSCATVCSC